MILGKVVGTVVATQKQESLIGSKLLIIRPDGEWSHTEVAIDCIGAGIGDRVLVVKGSSARRAGSTEIVTDAAVVAIVDTVETEGE